MSYVYLESGDQPSQRHVFRNHVVGNEDVLPRLSTVAERMGRGTVAPDNSGIFLGQYLRRSHFVLGLGLKHVDAVSRFRQEIRLVITH